MRPSCRRGSLTKTSRGRYCVVGRSRPAHTQNSLPPRTRFALWLPPTKFRRDPTCASQREISVHLETPRVRPLLRIASRVILTIPRSSPQTRELRQRFCCGDRPLNGGSPIRQFNPCSG